jgi:thiamine-monophosphate kinase
MSRLLGFEDYYYDGWLLATINLSDIAAAGAAPIGLLTSLHLPADMALDHFTRLLDGIDACCAVHGTHVLGGNLKEAAGVSLSATSLGWCDSPPLSRRGAAPGDLVLILGELGLFWAGTLAVQRCSRRADPADPLLRNILEPRAKTDLASRLRKNRLLTSCMDNSDGLQPSLAQLGVASGVAMRIDKAAISVAEEVQAIARRLTIDPFRLVLGWGDWQLVATCRPDRLPEIARIASEAETEAHVIGEVGQGEGVELRDGDRTGPLFPLDSERFSRQSWFTAGLDSYVDQMLSVPLMAPGDVGPVPYSRNQ